MTRPPAFKIFTAEEAGTVRVAPHGELDIATAPQLQAEFDRIVAIDGLERVIVDLRDLVFLDSTGLETIVKIDAVAARDGFALTVVRGPRAVERLFAVMRLDRKLQIVDDPGDLS